MPGLLPDPDPELEYGSILPFAVNPKTEEVHFAWPGVLRDLVRGLEAPKRVLEGEVDPMTGAIDTSLAVAGGGLVGGGLLAPRGALSMGAARSTLPMDEASRMARAREMGFDVDTFHGTRADFGEFDVGDIGYHFGTTEQANKRLRAERGVWGEDGEKILPVKIKSKNPLELPDVGEWNDPEVVARQILDTEFGRKHWDAIGDILDEAAEISVQYGDRDEWKASDDAADLLGEIRDLIKGDGYDSVRYRNQVENKFGDIPGLTEAAQAKYDLVNKEYHELRQQVAGRKPPLSSLKNPTPAQIQEWIDTPAAGPTRAEAERLAFLEKQRREIMETGGNDPYSYIVLDPRNVRSRFAAFDPTKSDSADLLAARAAPVPITPERGRETYENNYQRWLSLPGAM